jgi:hypothetical protein
MKTRDPEDRRQNNPDRALTWKWTVLFVILVLATAALVVDALILT